MDKTKLGLAAAISTLALGSVGAASAAPLQAQPIPAASSYADLLDPVPNAAERLAAVERQAEPDGARLIEAQYYPGVGVVHHHHHNNYYRRHWRHRHWRRHHHHHHNSY